MIEQDITLYAGQDFGMPYVVPPGSDMDLSEYEAVCKIRKRPYDDMKLELTPVVQSKQVGFFISGKDSAKAHLKGGDPFRYEDFTPEQLAALRGPKGDKGEDGRDGASATADNAHQLLLQGNVWCESAEIDDVLTALIGNMGKPFPRTEFKALTIPSVIQGQQVVSVTGEPHYSVKVVGNDTPFTLDSTGVCTITIPPLGEDDIKLTYHNFTSAKVGDYTIKGVQTGAPADDTIEVNGSVYKLYGDVLKMNITNNTVNGNFKDNPKNWNVTQKVIYANRPSTLNLGDNWNAYGPYYVETPENITFKGFNNNMRLTIVTSTQGTETLTIYN